MKSQKNSIGFVISIFVAPQAGEAMLKVIEVEAIAGKGLKGDRYASQVGFWQTLPNPRETVRDVSFINSFDIENSGFTETETRRNLVIQTEFDLVHLIDKHFYVGKVLFKGIEECTPCKRPSELSGKENFAQAFKNKGGLRAQVLKSGQIREMDYVVLAD